MFFFPKLLVFLQAPSINMLFQNVTYQHDMKSRAAKLYSFWVWGVIPQCVPLNVVALMLLHGVRYQLDGEDDSYVEKELYLSIS